MLVCHVEIGVTVAVGAEPAWCRLVLCVASSASRVI